MKTPATPQNTQSMDKKIFICGRIYDLTAKNHATITKKIQNRVDKLTIDEDNENVRVVNFSMQITDIQGSNEQDIEFIFSRNNILAKEGVNPELINDSDGLLMMGMDGRFKPAVMWDFVETFAFGRYHIPIEEFIPAYVGTATSLSATTIKGMQIESSKTELRLKIRV